MTCWWKRAPLLSMLAGLCTVATLRGLAWTNGRDTAQEVPSWKTRRSAPDSSETTTRATQRHLAQAFSRRLPEDERPRSHFKRAAAPPPPPGGLRPGRSRDIQQRFTKGPGGSERHPAWLSHSVDCMPLISQQVHTHKRAGRR